MKNQMKNQNSDQKNVNQKNKSASSKYIHIVGICGVATSALAIAFQKKGWTVTGSDKGFYPPVSTALEQAGIPFYAGWHPEKMGMPDFIVAGGSGTSLLNPEIIFAKEHDISVLSFAQALGKFFIKKNSIVTVGTWGKTTTSAILSFIMIKAGMNPSYFTGGLSLSHDTGALADSDWSIVEGDEWQAAIWDKQAKFNYYSPTHLLLTSVSWDHADLYPTEQAYFSAFEKLVSSIPADGLIVCCADNDGVQKVISKAICRVATYGKEKKEKPASYLYHSIRHTKEGIMFTITYRQKDFTVVSPMLGRFNAENITACFAMACEIGIDPMVTLAAIRDFKGIKRRLERRYEGGTTGNGSGTGALDITVLDCHAPTAEKATSVLESIREVYTKKILAVFEPNTGGRQRNSIAMYRDAFKDADMLFIPRFTKTKIDPNQTVAPLEGDELAAYISETHQNVTYIKDDKTLIKEIVETAKDGDVIVFLGSHGFRGMIEETIQKLEMAAG
jgi:UDP-N-acetylmuramate: L-alanyl-gamma-D-glutamyl-meso-diaminopimelate ligase